MTDNESGTLFCRIKLLPKPFWNRCVFAVHFKFIITNNFGKLSRAADFSIALAKNSNEKVILKISENVVTQPNEVQLESTGLA